MKTGNVTLKEYLCQKILGIETRLELNLKLNQVALDRAQAQMDERLERMNEFRDQLKDQASTFTTKSEHALLIASLAADIRSLRESRANLEGKASASSVYVAYVLAGIAIVVSIVGLFVS